MTKPFLVIALAPRSRKNRSSIVAVVSLLCVCCSLTGPAQVAAKQAEDARELVLNTRVERQISSGETHVYKISLAAGDYLRLFINPRPQGMKVESQLLAPGGSSDIGVYFFPTGGMERFVSLIAEAPGDYRLEIRPSGNEGTPEHYEVKVEELRPSRQQDKGRLSAEKVEREGRILTQNPFTEAGSVERFRQGLAKLQQDWKGKRLAVVASGALEFVPFAPLPLPVVSGPWPVARAQGAEEVSPNNRPPATDYRPLIAQHEIVNLPSASALAVNRRETAGRKAAERKIAIIADPVFEATDPRVLVALRGSAANKAGTGVRSGEESQTPSEPQASSAADSDLQRSLQSFSLSTERGGFSRLPFSREEADAIASLSPKDTLMEATDFQANRAIATGDELARYRIVHFATHGLL